MKKPDKRSLHDLLTERTQYRIPTYQRAYDWKHDKQVTDLFDDIKSCLESEENKELFLGTTIFEEIKLPGEKVRICEIIDGQQRLTTIFIFLVALRDYAKEHFDDELIDHIQEKIQIESPFRNRAQKNRLVPSNTISNVFANISKKDWDGEFTSKLLIEDKLRGVVYENRKIKPVFDALKTMIGDYCEGKVEKFEELFDQLIYNSYFIIIEIDVREEAFEIFERTNARGKGLEVSDLLKNYLFSKERKMDNISAEQVWNEITDRAGNNILRMLKYFWVSKFGYVSKRDLYTKIRRYADKVGINRFTAELLSFSKYFEAYYSPTRGEFKKWLEQNDLCKGSASHKTEIERIRNAFRLFKVTQIIPLLYSSITAMNRDENTKSSKVRSYIGLLRFLEFYHFANNKISIRVGNEVEKTYAEYCELFYKSKNFSNTCVKLRQQLEKKLAKSDEFEAGFSDLSYEDKEDKHLIRYMFDQYANSKVHSEQRIPIFDYFDIINGDQPSYNIDHILSQDEGKELPEEILHSIGNLIVMPRQMNSAFQNADFAQKVKLLENWDEYDNKIANPPQYLMKFIKENREKKKWKKADIKARQEALAKDIYENLKKGIKY